MATKAVRFNENEEEAIKDFLSKNPYLDFSTIARIAILNFIKNPDLKLIPIKPETTDKTRIQ